MGKEALADLEKVAKGHTAAQSGLGDDQEGETAGGGVIVLGGRFGNVVDVVVAVGVRELLRGLVCDFGENEGGEGGGLRGGGGGALGKYGAVVCYARTGEVDMLVSCVLVF